MAHIRQYVVPHMDHEPWYDLVWDAMSSMAGQTIIKIAYGIDVQPKNDPYIEAAEEALKAFAFGSTTRAGMFDTFPICTSLHIPSLFLFSYRSID